MPTATRKRLREPRPNMRRSPFQPSHRLAYRDGGIITSVFGFFFAAFGMAACTAAYNGTIRNRNGMAIGPGASVVAFLVGAIFLLIGLGSQYGRSGILIDRNARTVVFWWGIMIVPLSRTSFPLDDFRAVLFRSELYDGREWHAVSLLGASGDQLGLMRYIDPTDAKREAAVLAEFLDLPMYDVAPGTSVERSLSNAER